MGYTSFLSEHSCEYLIVHQVLEQLEPHFGNVIPLFYWSSREGGIMARQSMTSSHFRLFVVYPRRPKVSAVGDQEIWVNFNQLLFERAQLLLGFGVPSLAAVPLISDLKYFNRNALCYFWRIDPDGMQVEVRVSLTGISDAAQGLGVMAAGELAELVINECKALNGDKVLRVMGEMRLGFGTLWGMMHDQYKPVYFLITDDSSK